VREYGALWERDAALAVAQQPAEGEDCGASIAGGEFNTYRPRVDRSTPPTSQWSLAGPEIRSWPSYGSAPRITSDGFPGLSRTSLPSIPAIERVPTPSTPLAPAPATSSNESGESPRRRARLRRQIVALVIGATAIAASVIAATVLATPTPPPMTDRAQVIASVRTALVRQQPVTSVTCPPRIPKRAAFVVRCEAHLAPDDQPVDAYVTQRDAAGHLTTQYVLR
jgi:hypothetical protein